MGYTKFIEKRENKEKKGWKEQTLKQLKYQRERLNIKDIGFISIAKKLYIKYKELKINKRRPEIRCQTSDIRYQTSDSASVK